MQEESDVDWEDNEDVNSSGERTGEDNEISTDGAVKKKARCIYTKEDRAVGELRHKENLLHLIRKGSKIQGWTEDETLCVTIMSVLPSFLIQTARCKADEHVRDIFAWFNMTFAVIPNCSVTIEEGRDGSHPETLLSVFFNKTGSLHQLTQIFIVVLRICGFTTRYVCTIDPIGKHPRNYYDLSNKTENSEENSKSISKNHNVDEAPWAWAEVCIPLPITSENSSSSPNKSNLKRNLPQVRTVGKRSVKTASRNEMKSPSDVIDLISDIDNIVSTASPSVNIAIKSRWVHIEFNKCLIDEPRSIEERRGKRIMYAIAYDDLGNMCDVTARYAAQFSISIQDRLPPTNQFMRNLSAHWSIIKSCRDMTIESIEGIIVSSESVSKSDGMYDEAAELNQLALDETLPTTLAACWNHPKYVLDKDLRRNETLNPLHKKTVGIIKGIPVYLREHVAVLRNKYQWRREMRVVKDDEVPYRTVQKKKNDESMSIELFGEWQTRPYVVLPVVDGRLPINEYGNIEVWGGDERLVPAGSVLITAPSAASCAKKLGIQYAQALFGFESSGMKKHPVFGGVVVLSQDAELLYEAAIAIAADKDEKLEIKRSTAICAKWDNIVRSLLSRQGIRDRYGY